MGRNYSVNGNATTPASASLPLVTLISTANIRPKIYDFTFGNATAAANEAAKFQVQRCTTAGTPGSSIVPQALDPGDPTAQATSGLAMFSVGPTLSANALMYQFTHNKQAGFRWAPKDGKEIVLPATAANGVAFMNPQVTVAFDSVFSIQYEE